MPLPMVHAVRSITSMREGGSRPALVEADDGRQYVVKLRGAAQGPRVLAAEIIVGEMARTLGLRVPRIALVKLDEAFGKTGSEQEMLEAFQRSVGMNVGLEFVADATTFDRNAGDAVSAAEASGIVWVDALTMNVDRTAKNPNLLMQAGAMWLIDHGASLTFHFGWPERRANPAAAFEKVRDHVLLQGADEIVLFGEAARTKLTEGELRRIVALVPDEFLPVDGMSVEEQRSAYLEFLAQRVAGSAIFEEEIERVR